MQATTMQTYSGQSFEGIHDRDSGRTFSDMDFIKCQFLSCAVSITENPERRSIYRNMRFFQCQARACSVYEGILEDILVDGLKTVNQLKTWGAVFKHVTLKGRVGDVKISDFIPPGAGSRDYWDKVNLRFRAANAEYYRNVGWALDISQAEFERVDIRGVPASLVRRDTETQVVVSRDKVLAMQNEWRKLDLSRTYWAVALEDVIREEHNGDGIFVAPKRHARFKELLAGLQQLRRVGVAEPD